MGRRALTASLVFVAVIVLSSVSNDADALTKCYDTTSYVRECGHCNDPNGSVDGPFVRWGDPDWTCISGPDFPGQVGVAPSINVPTPARPGVPKRTHTELDPVTADGELLQDDTDLTFPGEGLNFEFSRTYRSRTQHLSDLGYSWAHNYDQTLTFDCDLTATYSDGRSGSIVFKPDPNGFLQWQSDYREKLALIPAGAGRNGKQKFNIVDWNTGNTSTFEDYGAGALRLTTITSPSGASIRITWTVAPGKGWHVASVLDSTGRTIYYNYYPPASNGIAMLHCLSLAADCSAPLVAFQYDYNAGELTAVTKGVDAKGTTYKYHHGEKDVSWLPNDMAPAVCQSLCNAKTAAPAAGCNNTDYCGQIFRMCQVPDYAACVRYQEASCDVQYCGNSTDQLCFGNNCGDTAELSQYCSGTGYLYSQYQQTWLNSYLTPDKAPFCADAWTGQAGCANKCVDFYRNKANAYTFGVPADLNHNIIEIDDANGNVILKNTYGTNPGDISFDRVTDQQLGDSTHGQFQYHDLNIEATYTTAPLPSTPDATHVVPKNQFNSLSVCPSLSCSTAGCPAAIDDTTAEAPQQRPAFAVVFTNIYGTILTKYFNGDWDLLREVNWGDTTTGVQTTDYNYGTSGNLTSDGLVSAVQRPAGDRVCMARNDAGGPTTILHIPAATYGNADWRAESFTYVSGSSNAAMVRTYSPDTAGSSAVTYNGALGSLHPDSVTIQVDSTKATTTTLEYNGHFLPSKRTDASGAITQFDQFDTLAAQPKLTTVDATGPSPLQTYAAFDPLYSLVQETGLVGGAAVHYTYDQAGRTSTVQRRNSPADSWFSKTLGYNNTPYASQTSDANLTQSPTYNAFGDLISLTEVPADPADAVRKTCNSYAADGRLLGTIRAAGDSTRYQYDAVGNLTSTMKGFGAVFLAGCPVPPPTPGDPGIETVASSSFGTDGFLKSFSKEGVTYDVKVDGYGRVIETANGVGVKARKGYDRLDRVVWEAVYQDAYDPVCKKHVPPNCPESIVPPYGVPQFGDAGLISASEYTYDNLGRIITSRRWHLEDQTKRVRTTTYDDVARTVTVVEGDRTTVTTFDGAGRVVQLTEADGSTERTAYSNNGLKAISTRQSNAGPIITERDYDGLQLLSTVIVNGQEVFSETHDFDGRALSQSKEGAGARTITYDSFRRPKFVYPKVAPGQQPFAMQQLIWDGDDRLKEVDALPGPQQTVFVYDGLGRVLRQVDPLNRVSRFVHERGSFQLTSETLPSGLQRTNSYDPAGQLSRTTLHVPSEPVDVVKTFTYSPLGKIATASITGNLFGANNMVTLTYDSLGRTVSETNSYVNAGVSHNYDLYDQWRSSWVGAPQTGAPQMNHVYDKLRRLASVDVRGSRLAQFGYGSAGIGGPVSIAYPQISEASTLSYDPRGRLVGVDVKGLDGQLRASRHSVFGSDGILRERQTRSTTSAQVLTDVFQVDLMGAVIAENNDATGVPLLSGNVDNNTVAPFMQTGQKWRSYVVNRLSNIQSVTTPNGTATRTYNSENQLTGDTAATAIQYDVADNLTRYATATSNLNTTFDAEKHPVAIDGPAGNLVYLVYDALGRRIAENEAGASTLFIWDGSQVVGHSSGTQVYLDVPGDDVDSHLAFDKPSASGLGIGGQVYLHEDRDWSVFAATDATGVLAAYTYSAFGEPHVYAKAGAPNTGNRFLFQGQRYDAWTGSYSMRAREYYPQIARFGSTDPIGLISGSANLYGFVDGNPLAFGDPAGLHKKPFKRWFGHFALGMFMGGLQGEVPGGFLLKQPPISKPYLQGAAIALVVSGVVNGVTAIAGGGEGTALCGTGVGCLAGGPLIAVSLVVGANAIGGVYTGVQTWKDSSNQMSAEEPAPTDDVEADADAIQSELDPIAQTRRTTAVGTGTGSDGKPVTIAAGGGSSNLTPAQREAAQAAGIDTTSLPADSGAHAEYKVLEEMRAGGIMPDVLAASRAFCPACAAMIQDAGGRLVGVGKAIWGSR